MKKKHREVRFRHYLLTRILIPFVRFFIKQSYKLKLKQYKALKDKGPFIVLSNHTINVDPMVMGLHFPFHLYYIATEQVFNLGFKSRLIKYIVNPIKKSKSISDMETIRKSKRIVDQGGSIGIYPEGNTNYSGITAQIMPSTVKLIKLLKIPVIILNTEGLYLSYPRWAIYRKKGKTTSFIKKIILPESYMDMTDEALYESLKTSLYVNAYDDQESTGNLYKGKKLAHGLEKLIFIDLDKGEPFVTYSDNDTLKSKVSSFKLTYLTNGKVRNDAGVLFDLNEIEVKVKIAYFEFYKNTTQYELYKEKGIVRRTYATNREKLGAFQIALNKDGIYLKNHQQVYKWHFDDVENIVMQGKYQIIVYVNNETYIIRLDDYSSIYKYVLTYQYYKYIKQGGTSINDNYYNFGI